MELKEFNYDFSKIPLQHYIINQLDIVYNTRNFGVVFNHNMGSNELFYIKNQECSISVFFKTDQRFKNNTLSSRYVHFQKREFVDFNLPSDNTSIEYSMRHNGIFQKIYIGDSFKNNRFSFIFKCENLKWKFLKDDMKIVFKNRSDEREMFCVPLPFAIDNNGDFTINIVSRLKKIDDDVFQLTIIPNEDWIKSVRRKFPVVMESQVLVRT